MSWFGLSGGSKFNLVTSAWKRVVLNDPDNIIIKRMIFYFPSTDQLVFMYYQNPVALN